MQIYRLLTTVFTSVVILSVPASAQTPATSTVPAPPSPAPPSSEDGQVQQQLQAAQTAEEKRAAVESLFIAVYSKWYELAKSNDYDPKTLRQKAVSITAKQSASISIANSTAKIVDAASFHNEFRKKHNAPNMTHDQVLADSALTHVSRCIFQHDANRAYGANLYTINSTVSSEEKAVQDAVALWYRESKDYKYDDPKFSMNTGSFTQVVWKASTKVGCAVAKCRIGTESAITIVSCKYHEPGNFPDKFKENVLPPTEQ